MGEVQRAAMDWLFGRSYATSDQLAEEAWSVTADMVSRFAQVVRNNTIFAVPGETIIAPWMGEKIPTSSGERIEGRKILHADAPVQTARLVSGPEGISIQMSDGSHLTVRYANLAAALHYDNGGLTLASAESTWLQIEPTMWRNGARVCEEIRGKIPAHLILEQGPRDKDAIPMPTTTAWQRFRATLAQILGLGRRHPYFFLALPVVIDLALLFVNYQWKVNLKAISGLMCFSSVYYIFLLFLIEKGRWAIYTGNPAKLYLIYCFFFIIHLWLLLKMM